MVSGAPAAGSAGFYAVTVTATDSNGYSASQSFLWTVNPAVTITDPGVQSGAEGSGVSLQIQATDAAGGTLTFSETGLPPGLSISGGGQITGTISAGDAANGPYVAAITATDGTYTGTQTVLWVVTTASGGGSAPAAPSYPTSPAFAATASVAMPGTPPQVPHPGRQPARRRLRRPQRRRSGHRGHRRRRQRHHLRL